MQALQTKQQRKDAASNAKRLESFNALKRWRNGCNLTPGEQDFVFQSVLQKLFKHNFGKPFDLERNIKRAQNELKQLPTTQAAE